MRKMVMMLDPDGVPRCYGVAPTEDEARKLAQEQLVLYRKKKHELGDRYLATAEYAEEVHEVE